MLRKKHGVVVFITNICYIFSDADLCLGIMFQNLSHNRCDLGEKHGNMSRDEGWALFQRIIFRVEEYRG